MLVRSAKKNSFIVGADVNLIGSLPDRAAAEKAGRQGQAVYSKLEDLKIPTVAAVDGPCAGGGTELILACRHRLCSDNPKTAISLPEVKLGFLPGWGGTYRLPKTVGLMTAVDMMLTGKSIRADKAAKLGLVDLVVPAAIFEEKSLEIAARVAEGKGVPGAKPRVVPLTEKALTGNPIGRFVFFRKARDQVHASTGGRYPSPLRILDLLEQKSGLGREAYMDAEANAFADLWSSPESKSLVGLFLMGEAAKRDTGSELTPEAVAKLQATRSLLVLGAGVMGGGIAAVSAAAGVRTTLKDLNFDAIAKGLAHARSLFDADLRKKRITKTELERRMGLVRGQIDFRGVRATDLVIEAVVENIDVKKKVFAELEEQVSPTTVIATNTSSLRLKDMLPAFKDASRFIGLHFFNPVHKMPLVEVVTHPGASPEAVARGVAYVKSIGKTPVVCGDGPGFIVNRLLMPWLNEAAFCLWEGYPFEALERAAKDFGMPMGPFELLDEVGLDVAAKVCHIFHDAFGERAKPSPILDKLVADKSRLGRKTGLGFYVFDAPGGRKQGVDLKALEGVFAGAKPSSPEFNAEALVRRMFFPMVNEAARALKEGVVNDPAKVDLAMIFGTGFPPFRGGLLKWADSLGVDKIVAELERLGELHGARLQPSSALREIAKRGGFYRS